MGRITCCNVLSDLYAMGVTNCDNLLLILGIPTSMTAQERMITSKLIIQGFRDCGLEAGTLIRGGQTIKNPWMMIGGVATSICAQNEFIMPNQAKPGDVLVLTKALGTHVAVNAHSAMKTDSNLYIHNLIGKIDDILIEKSFEKSVNSMATLNLNGARLMQKYQSNGCTDVTGFGILNHAKNLAKVQVESVDFIIDHLPLLYGVEKINASLNDKYNLLKGTSPETSGGLLIILPEKNVDNFLKDYSSDEYGNNQAWIVGRVVKGERTANLSNNLTILSQDY